MLKCENLPSTNSTKSGAHYNFSKTSTPLGPIYKKFGYYDHPPKGVKTFKETFYSSSQLIIFVSDELKVAFKSL